MSSLPTRARAALHVLRRSGPGEVYRRTVTELYRRTGGGDLAEFPLLLDDVVSSDSLRLRLPTSAPVEGTPLTVGWVTTPPALGSGGHTTMFRMVEALETAGHRCVLFLYDRFDSDLRAREAIVRQGWPRVRAEVRDVRDGVVGVDAAVATSWPSAHALARHGTAPMQRLYFIQDFEPWFYARGSEAALAEDTYRFGFHHIALGHSVASVLDSLDLQSTVVEFGCDTDTYGLRSTAARSGVVFFARPGVPRRGFLLGCLALREFHSKHPDQEIHVYGGPPTQLGFPATHHAKLTPRQLDELYNTAVGGLALSFTNITLVAEEMLASGVVPVLNDSPHARAGIANPHVVWAEPNPGALAEALGAVVAGATPERFRTVAASATTRSWAPSQQAFVAAVEVAVCGTTTAGRGRRSAA